MHPSDSIPKRGRSTSAAWLAALLILSLLSLEGCAWLVKPPPDDAAARACMRRWQENNADLDQFKGLMRIRVQSTDSVFNERAAIAVAAPDKIRVEILSPIGQPLYSLAGNGSTLAVYSTADRKYYRTSQSKTALSYFLHVPISVADLIDILCGRPPVIEYRAAQHTPGEDTGCAVTLKDRWHNTLATIGSDPEARIRTLSVYNAADDSVAYKVHWDAWRRYGDFLLASKVSAITGTGNRIDFQIERLWPGVTVPDNVFELEEPEK